MQSRLKEEKRSTIWHRDPLPVGGEGETEGLRDGGQRRSVTKVISTLPQIRLMEKGRDHPLLSIEEDCGKPTPHICPISAPYPNQYVSLGTEMKNPSSTLSLSAAF